MRSLCSRSSGIREIFLAFHSHDESSGSGMPTTQSTHRVQSLSCFRLDFETVFLGVPACFPSPFHAVGCSQPEAETTLANLKAEAALSVIVRLLALIRVLVSIFEQPLFESGIVGIHLDPRTLFVKIDAGCLMCFRKTCFHGNLLILTCFFPALDLEKMPFFSIEMLRTICVSSELLQFQNIRFSRLLTVKTADAPFWDHTKEEYRKHIGEVKARLDAAIKDASTGIITNEFVAQYIDKIFVTLTDDDTAKLEIKIFTGKSTEKWLKKLNARSRSRTGVTSKKMIEKYENDLSAK